MKRIVLAVLLVGCAACRVGPNYKRPTVPAPVAFKEPAPASFKEAQLEGWKQAAPGDAFEKGRWWEIYGDPALNALEEQVSISNQNVIAAEAQYRQAKAQITVARSALFPVVSLNPGVTESRGAGGATAAAVGSTSATSRTRTFYQIPFDVSWEPDLWGRIRRGVTASSTTAQAFAADLENAKLLYQAELARDYFGLHGTDTEMDLLNRTAASYQEYLTLTRNRDAAGVASDLDVAQAESQLHQVEAQKTDLEAERAQFEHAIATLTGKPPADLSIPTQALTMAPPAVPIGLPSELLERRPDIAGAERRVASANEQIGIAMAAYYPSLSLSATGGLESSTIGKLFSWPSRFWSVGPQLAETLFDAGRRRGVVAGERAAYDATVAQYRQTVLTALQQVEDNLAALRVLEIEAGQVAETLQSANRALAISNAQYRAGTTSYLTVITSQAAALNAERTQVTLLTRRLSASVSLVEALGGGWDRSRLP